MAARLRACISEEKRSPGAHAMYAVGAPDDEFQYCSRGMGRLRTLLQQVSLDPVTHERFMSVFLHLEGRLNRIPKVSQALNLSDVIFQKNEEYSELFNEFVEKVKKLSRPKRIANNNPIVTNMSENESHTSPVVPNLSNNRMNAHNAQAAAQNHANATPPIQQTNSGDLSLRDHRIQTAARSISGANPNLTSQANVSRASQARQNGELINRNSIGTNPNIIFQDTINDSNFSMGVSTTQSIVNRPSDGNRLSFLQHLMGYGTHFPANSNATMISGHNTRLSEQFQPNYRPLLTPIASSANEQRPIYTQANGDAMPKNRMNDTRTVGYLQPADSRGLLQIAIPPENYGENRVNSLPSGFGGNIPRTNIDLPNAATRPTMPNHTYNVNNNQFSNEHGGHPPRSNPNGPNINVPLYDMHNAYNTNNDQVPNNNFMGNNYRQRNATSSEHRQLPNETEEKLDLIIQQLTSLSDEVTSFRQWKNSLSSDNFRAMESSGSNINPSATYTANARSTHSIPNHENHSQFTFTRNSSNFIPIHKWNWKFSADKTSEIPERRDLAAFLKKLELYRQAENLSHEEIHRKFHFLIDGCVYEWYMQYRQNFADWNQLLEGLKKQFTTPLTHFMKVAKLAARRQNKNETAMTYIASIQREFDELGMYSEKEKISIIQNGLNDRLRNVALSHAWTSVQEMDLHLRTIEVADELRKETESQVQKRPFFLRRAINTVDIEQETEMGGFCDEDEDEKQCENVDQSEINCQVIMAKSQGGMNYKRGSANKSGVEQNEKNESKETQTRKMACYNCKSERHRLIDCEESITRIFCFRCGNEGVRAPNCTCASKNVKSVACSVTEPCDQL